MSKEIKAPLSDRAKVLKELHPKIFRKIGARIRLTEKELQTLKEIGWTATLTKT